MIRMRSARVLAVAIGAVLAVAPAAGAKGPINISAPPDATVTDPTGDPEGPLRYAAIGGGERTALAAIWTAGGELRNVSSLAGNWALPAVTVEGDAGGLSADGETLVLIRPDYSFRPESTRFLVLDPHRPRAREPVTLDGSFSFDAISPDGETIYLVEYHSPGNPLDYRVRAYDVSSGRLLPDPIVDPAEPDEQMGGYAVARETSPDGRWTYTLYTGGEETFVHALDTVGRTAACIDLIQFESVEQPYGTGFGLDVDPSSGEITVLQRGDPAAAIDPDGFEVTPISAAPPADESGPGALPFLAAIGVAGLAGIGLFAIRRRRRHADESELGRVFAGAQAAETEAERDREPDPVP
jgi:hypothetical protein